MPNQIEKKSALKQITKLGVGVKIAFDGLGNLYVTDTRNARVLMVPAVQGAHFGQSMSANYMYCLAECLSATRKCGSTAPQGTIAYKALIDGPNAIAVDSQGNVYFSQFADYMKIPSGK